MGEAGRGSGATGQGRGRARPGEAGRGGDEKNLKKKLTQQINRLLWRASTGMELLHRPTRRRHIRAGDHVEKNLKKKVDTANKLLIIAASTGMKMKLHPPHTQPRAATLWRAKKGEKLWLE